MGLDIEEIVSNLRIREKKQQLLKNRDRILHIKYQMSQLTFNRTVGLYAFTIDEMEYLIHESKRCNDEKRHELYAKIKELEAKALSMQEDPLVKQYIELRDEYLKLLFDNDYFVTVNIGLREELSKIGVPNIYVAQHEYDHDKNIVDKSPLVNESDKKDLVVILPVYNMKSFRDYRHFYNKTSFRYLEELSRDCSFDLKGKNLGKVRTLSLEKKDSNSSVVW